MKTVRLVSIAMAVVMFVVAIIPFATTPVSALANNRLTTAAPAESFLGAVHGLPLMAPMSIGLPAVSISPENTSSYGCSLVSQSPKDWVKMKIRQSFDMTWTVQNTGNAVWHTGVTTISYVSGAKMQTHGNSFDISADVSRGGKSILTVDMIAPKVPGTYTALWALSTGKAKFCRVSIILTVVR